MIRYLLKFKAIIEQSENRLSCFSLESYTSIQ